MFETKDLGSEVKVVELSGMRTRGYVVAVSDVKKEVEIHVEASNSTVKIPYKKISTVTRIEDFS